MGVTGRESGRRNELRHPLLSQDWGYHSTGVHRNHDRTVTRPDESSSREQGLAGTHAGIADRAATLLLHVTNNVRACVQSINQSINQISQFNHDVQRRA